MKFESRKHHETFYFIGYCEVSAILIAWLVPREEIPSTSMEPTQLLVTISNQPCTSISNGHALKSDSLHLASGTKRRQIEFAQCRSCLGGG